MYSYNKNTRQKIKQMMAPDFGTGRGKKCGLPLVIIFVIIAIFILKTSMIDQPQKVQEERPKKNFEGPIDEHCIPKDRFNELRTSFISPRDAPLLNYVKCHHLTRPSTLPYNLSANVDPSQFLQELDTIFKNRKEPGFFIECGAHDGQYLSNTLELERTSKWTGLLIEAMPSLVKKLKTRQRNAWVADVCLSPENSVGEIEMLSASKINKEWQTGLGKLKMEGDTDKTKFVSEGLVHCFPLVTLLTAIGVNQVDYFSLDVQGVDLKVLKTLPFDPSLIIDVIHASFDFVPEGPEAMKSFVESKGYVTVKKTDQDFLFVRKGSPYSLNSL